MKTSRMGPSLETFIAPFFLAYKIESILTSIPLAGNLITHNIDLLDNDTPYHAHPHPIQVNPIYAHKLRLRALLITENSVQCKTP